MKKFLLTAALIIATSSLVHAQNYGFDLYLRGGVVVPNSPEAYAHDWQAGPSIGTGFEFTLSQSVSIGVGFGYLRNSLKKDYLLDGTSSTGTKTAGGVLDMYNGFIFLNFRALGQVAHTFPYFSVDGGVTHQRISKQTVSYLPPLSLPDRSIAGASETAFHAAWGVGLDVPFSANIAFTCSGKYVFVFTQGDKKGYVPIEGGFKLVF